MAQPTVNNEPLREAIVAFIDGDDDPYSACAAVVALALETALGDGVNDAMSQGEFESLERVAMALVDGDPGACIEIDPRAG